MNLRCPYCGEPWDHKRPVGFRDTCSRCGKDLHICRNCRFHERGAYNDCRESQAERVLDKERANFCEYFAFQGAPVAGGAKDGGPGARSRLEDLFRK